MDKKFFRMMYDDLTQQNHVDIDIICAEEQVVRAHQNILAYFSSYFRSCFGKCSNQNLSTFKIVLLPTISAKDFRLLLNLLYLGTVTIEDALLPIFMKLIKTFHLPEFSIRYISRSGMTELQLVSTYFKTYFVA